MKTILTLALIAAAGGLLCEAGNLDTMGVTLLRAGDATLTGTGISVALAEAQGNTNDWEVYPPNAGQIINIFTWINTNGSSTTFPNSLGKESDHDDTVGNLYLGSADGVAPGAFHVDNYEADHFYFIVVVGGLPISDNVVNQSFVFTGSNPPQTTVDSTYDNYMANHGNLFVRRWRGRPAFRSRHGLQRFGGRYLRPRRHPHHRPHPGQWTFQARSGSAGRSPQLFHALCFRRDRRPLSSGRSRRWRREHFRRRRHAHSQSPPFKRRIETGRLTHTTHAPLDTRYGAGVLNLYYSHQQLAGGQQSASVSGTVSSGAAHPPGTPTAVIPSLLGLGLANSLKRAASYG